MTLDSTVSFFVLAETVAGSLLNQSPPSTYQLGSYMAERKGWGRKLRGIFFI